MRAHSSNRPFGESASKRRRLLASVFVIGVGTMLAYGQGCSSSAAPPPPPPGSAPPPPPRVVASASASASASATASPYTEADFQESDSSRDPFHNYVRAFGPSTGPQVAPQFTVLLEKYSIDELRLAAIVTSGDGVRAMFIDPQGKGWAVMRGQHMGRGENVKLGDKYQSSYPLYWKVDKVKPEEVVLIREDSLHPEVPPTYREIPLHPEGDRI